MAIDGTERRIERAILHKQLADILRADIVTGRLSPGAALPSEHRISEAYGVSRQTVRRAMADLAVAGLVQRWQGKGTFVARPRGITPEGRRGMTVGVLVTHLDSWFMLDALAGIERTASQAGFAVTIRAVGDGHESVDGGQPAAADQLREGGAAGLIVWPAVRRGDEATYFADLTHTGFPVVFFDRYLKGCPTPHVVSDNFRGGADLGRHVLGLGHRRLAWLAPRESGATSVRERLAGVRSALAEANLPAAALVEPGTRDSRPAEIRQAVEGVMAQTTDRRPTAILCGSDHIAPEVLSTLRALGAHVPDDVAVTGFDDLPYAAWLNPPLTSVRQSPRMMGEMATLLLLEMLADCRLTGKNVVLPVELRVRASTVGGAVLPGLSRDARGREPEARPVRCHVDDSLSASR